MQYAPQGDLLKHVLKKRYTDGTAGRLKEDHARWFFQQAIVALDYMHLLGYCSRDFKLENCGLFPARNPDRPLLKLIDFATSKVRRRTWLRSPGGVKSALSIDLPQSVDRDSVRAKPPIPGECFRPADVGAQ